MSSRCPYSGTLKVDPKPLYPAEHFVVVLPKSMHFAPAPGVTSFKSMADPNNADTIVQVAQQTHPGQAARLQRERNGDD